MKIDFALIDKHFWRWWTSAELTLLRAEQETDKNKRRVDRKCIMITSIPTQRTVSRMPGFIVAQFPAKQIVPYADKQDSAQTLN